MALIDSSNDQNICVELFKVQLHINNKTTY